MGDYLITLEPVRPGMPDSPTDDESALVAKHFDHLASVCVAGDLLLAGRTTERPWLGLAILRDVSLEHAQRIVEDDPAVAAGIFRARLQPFRVALMQDD